MTADEVFSRYGIRKTLIRSAILTALLEKHEGLTYAELSGRIGKGNNKANIQRALNFFQITGVVRKIVFAGPRLRYYYNERKSNNHIYFTCEKCNSAYVFISEAPVVCLPESIKVIKIEFIVSGTCPCCNENTTHQ